VETILLYLLGILIILIGLLLSIGLHEIGHLVPAKLFGVRVAQYMIGFGRTLFSVRRGETEYGIKALPFGGYISMTGMFPPVAGGRARTASTGFFQTMTQDARSASAETIVAGEEERAFYRLATWKRIIIMCGGPFMNLVIAVILYAVVLSGFGVSQVSTTLGSVSDCVLPATSSRQTCAAGDPASPSLQAGFRPGDRLLSMNGTTITTWSQATAIIQKSPNQPIAVVVNRGGSDVTLTATPLLSQRYVYDSSGRVALDGSGKKVTENVGFLGIGAATEVVQQPVSSVLPAVGNNIAAVVGLVITLPQRLVQVGEAAFGSGARDPNGPIGLVGVGRMAGEVASLNSIPIMDRAALLVNILASLNIALLVLNLVPLLPFDGGHIAGALWESIRRFFAKLFKRPDPGPVDVARLIPLTMAVVVVLGAMSLLLVYADIVKPISLFR
jgi:membrane-associated protease RseP (regulator of RpoE activity)